MTESGQDPSPVKVMVVSDSDISRKLLTEVMESAPGITIAAKPINGFLAASRLKSSKIDVVVLDV
ncbi:MAG: chemotaxis response regulator protein-glutamate methylesterase, partial [Magnetovibrio sp.]|nr:chemotaxis response regulator protein-glutamate methylesterase [Magnetovibrio sp.]